MTKLIHYQDLDGPVSYTVEEVLDLYYEYWAKSMILIHKIPMITEKNCIEDFIVVNWAHTSGGILVRCQSCLGTPGLNMSQLAATNCKSCNGTGWRLPD